jgi:hypothetical protein
MRAATNAAACSLTISVAVAPDFSYDTESLEELEEIKREEDLERREAEEHPSSEEDREGARFSVTFISLLFE